MRPSEVKEMEVAGSSETLVNLYHTFMIILVLQPGSRLDHPYKTSLCHSVCCLHFPVVNSIFSTHRHLFLLVCLLSICPACISWGFLARVVLQGDGVSLKPNHRLVDQTSIFMCLETGWSTYTPRHWVSILVTSYDRHGLCWGCFVPNHHMGNVLHYTVPYIHSHHCENLKFPKGSPYLFLHRCYFILDQEGEDIINSEGLFHVCKRARVGKQLLQSLSLVM